MSRDEMPISDLAEVATSEDAEVARVLDAYLAELEAGRAAAPERLLAEHPAIADQLRACLQVLHLAERVADDGSGQGSAARSDSMAVPLARSVLSSWNYGGGPAPQIRLHDLANDEQPLLRPRSPAMPATPAGGWGRYQLQGEIAHGGMGAVIKGHDVDLGRDVAIKILLESHRGNCELLRRLVEEAQIVGQLQHPGIVPVYELGACADRRPYFTMKLVRGRSLASMLKGRTDTQQDAPGFLSIFEAICQTMAYAHARGVIHRDLKPSNIMVGGFGEVQVMDWGLAKVMPRGEAEAKTPADLDDVQVVTVRSGSGSDASHAGSVLGTPSYMAPEQARGELDRLDERADVFGLGAILCEILTGKPPFVGIDRKEIHDRAARGDLADAEARLSACTADPELVSLCRTCLAPDPASRPRNAGEVAARITTHLAGVQERLRQAELARVQAETKAAEERKRRRVTMALAASVLTTAGLAVGGWTYLSRQRTARLMATTRVVADALAEAERLRGQAQLAAVGDLTKWSEAMGAGKRARDMLAEGEADAALRARVRAALADLEQEQAAAQKRAAEAERDRKLLAELESIRGNRSEHWNPTRTDAEYGAAFQRFGMRLDELDPKEAASTIARRLQPGELISYLDDWIVVRRFAQTGKTEERWRRLIAIAQAADPDPWRATMRERLSHGDRTALQRLATDQKALERQSVQSLALLASALTAQGDGDQAEQVLRRAWRREPGNFWTNFYLGKLHGSRLGAIFPDRHMRSLEAVRYYSICVAIQPRSFAARNNLASVLGDPQEAEAEWREALRLKPNDFVLRRNHALTLQTLGELVEADAEYREAIRLKPDHSELRRNYGELLLKREKWGEAANEFREALRLRPDDTGAMTEMGIVLKEQGKLDEAIAEYNKALRLNPRHPNAHANLAVALRKQGDFAGAIAEFRKAREFAGGDKGLAEGVGRELSATERLASLAPRLPDVLAGKVKLTDPAETIEYANLCLLKGLTGASARLWADVFRSQPELASDRKSQHRYNAACAAALAAAGQGKDEPPLDEAAKARWRKQALVWLTADLAAWSKVIAAGQPEARQSVLRTVEHWRADPDLAGVREPDVLSRLPGLEQNDWQGLWERVDALLQAPNGQSSNDGPAPPKSSAKPGRS
jgi:serine/threonine-protein kinase